MNKLILSGILAATLVRGTAAAAADPPYQSSPERRTIVEARDWGKWAGPFREKLIPSMMQDFGERYLYKAANARLPLPVKGRGPIVFLGDSITDFWDLAKAFPNQPYVNRGIAAQVTAQMLVRFEQDVVALQPRVVVILAGTNDVTGFLQLETPETIVGNITAMADIADARHIQVVLCSLLPVNSYTEGARSINQDRPPATLRTINIAIRRLARQRGYTYADYAAELADEHGILKRDYSNDGLHPNASGYAIMKPIIEVALHQAVVRPVVNEDSF